MIFIFLSTLVHEIPIWTLFSHFWVDGVNVGNQKFQKSQIFEIVVSKSKASPQISLYYWLSSFYRHWYMKYKFGSFLTQFWVNDVKLQYFEKSVTETNFPHFKVPLNIDFDLSVTLDTWHATFGSFLQNLKLMTSEKKYIFQNFGKLTKKNRFDLLKMLMARSVEVSIVVWSRYIILKLFWKTFKNDVIKGPLFHTFHQAFYKTFVILVFWNKKSLFVPIFIMIDWKLGPI